MAKKDEVDLDNFDLDNFDFDLPDFEADDHNENSRSPITRALKGAVRGVKDNIKDTATLRRAVSMALPEGYGLAADTLDSAITDTKQLYDKITGESPEIIRNSKSFGRKAMAKVGDKILPDALAKRLNAALEDNEESEQVKSSAQLKQEQEDNDIAALNNLLRVSRKADETRYKKQEADNLEAKATQKVQYETTATLFSSINRSLAAIVGYQNQVDIKYKRKSLELMYRQYSATKSLADLMAVATEKHSALLEQIKHNTGLPDAVKIRQSEMFGQLAKQRLMGGALNTFSNWSQNYRKQVMDNVQGMAEGFLSPLMQAREMTEGMDKSDLAGYTLGAELSNQAINHASVAIAPWLEKNQKIKSGGEKLRNWFTGIPNRLNEWAQPDADDQGTGGGSVFKSLLKTFLPRFALNASAGGESLLSMDEPSTFDKIARRTLIEVIPGHLAEIAYWSRVQVTGVQDEKKVYSVVRGGFTTESENLKDVSRQIVSRSEKDSLKTAVSDFTKKLGGDQLSPKALRILQKKILHQAASGRDLDPAKFADPAAYAGEDAEAVEEIRDHLTDHFGLDWSGKMTDTSAEGERKFNDTRRDFINLSQMIPAFGDRTRVLADLLGRDNLRKLGFTERMGREDRINFGKYWDMVLDDDDETKEAPKGDQTNRQDPPTPTPTPPKRDDRPGDNPPDVTNGPDRVGSRSDRRERGRPTKVDLSRWLGEKSLLIKILQDSNTKHESTVKGLEGIRQIMLGWQMAGVSSARPASPSDESQDAGRMQKFLDRFKGFKLPSPEQRSSFVRTLKSKVALPKLGGNIGKGLGGLLGGAAGLGVKGAWNTSMFAAKMYLGALMGMGKLAWGGTKFGLNLGGGILGGIGKLFGGKDKDKEKGPGFFAGMKDRYNSIYGNMSDRIAGFKDKHGNRGKEMMGNAQDFLTGKKAQAEEFYRAQKGKLDAYLEGDANPRLLEWKLKAGKYWDSTTGKTIKTWNDIQGNVMEGKNKVALKYEEIQANGGLKDAAGKKLTDWKDRAKGLWNRRGESKQYATSRIDAAKDMLKGMMPNGWDPVKTPWAIAGKASLGGIKKLGALFGTGKLGSDISSKLTGDFEKDMITLNLRQAQLLGDTYSLMKKKIDGETVRSGSLKDIALKRLQKEKDAATAKLQGKYSDAQGLFAKGGALAGLKDWLKKKGEDEGDEEDGDSYTNIDLGGGEEGKKGRGKGGRGGRAGRAGGKPGRFGRVGKFFSKIGEWGSRGLGKMGTAGKIIRGGLRGAGMLAKGAWNVAKFGGKMAWGAAKLGKGLLLNPVTRVAAKTLGKVALGAVAGIGALVSAPVVGAALLAWTLWDVGSFLWKRYHGKFPPLLRVRVAQYGLRPYSGTDGVDKVLQFEKICAKVTTVNDDGSVKLDINKLPLEQAAAVFGIKMDDPEDEDTQEALSKLIHWASGRFLKAYSAHVAMAYKLLKTTDLDTVDDKVKGKVALEFMEAVRLKDAGALFDDDTSPSDDFSLNQDAGDVDDWWKDAYSDLSKDAEKSGENAQVDKDFAKEVQNGSVAATAAAMASAGAFDGDPSKNRIDLHRQSITNSLKNQGASPLAAAATMAAVAGTGALVMSTPTMSVQSDTTRLDFGNPVRYKVYGLTEMQETKVAQLSNLETICWPMVNYNKDNSAFLKQEQDAYTKFLEIFALSASDVHQDSFIWFHQRYLPAFLKYCSAVRARATIDAKDATQRLTTDQLLAVLKEMVGATASDGRSVWEVTESPWEGYFMNTDRRSVDQNLNGLAAKADNKVLSESGLAKADKTTDAKGNIIKTDPTQTNRPAGATSTSGPFIPGVTPMQDQSATGSMFDKVKSWFSSDSKPTPTQVPMQMNSSNFGSGQSMLETAAAVSGSSTMITEGSVSHMGGGAGGDINKIPMPTGVGWDGNKATILAAANMVGVDPALAAAIAGVESGYNPKATPGTSSAGGYYQVINSTWQHLMETYGSKYGINSRANQFDPRANALLGLSYIKENYDILSKKLNRKVTDTDIYMAHFLGLGGAKRFLTAPPGDPAINHVTEAQVRANKSIFFDKSGRALTVAQVYNNFSDKLQKHRKPDARKDMEAQTGMAAPNTGGDASADPGAATGDSAAPDNSVPKAAPGGGGAFDPANLPDKPSLAKPAGSDVQQPQALGEAVPSAASDASSGTRVSQTAQQIQQQAEIADLQTSGQQQAMANNFGGVEGVLRDSLTVQKAMDDKLAQLVDMVTSISSRGSATDNPAAGTPGGPQSRQSPTTTTPRPLPKGTVSMNRG